jgi:uncharacterized protein
VQHALRAFTAADRKAIRLASENYPISEFYKTDEVITSLGIGEALVTSLSEKGIPTPLAATLLRAPESRMDILTPPEIESINNASDLVRKYREDIDRESAYEILGRKVESGEKERATYRTQPGRSYERRRTTAVNPVVKVLTSATFIRGVLGILSKSIRK